jgi:hypothetical protein
MLGTSRFIFNLGFPLSTLVLYPLGQGNILLKLVWFNFLFKCHFKLLCFVGKIKMSFEVSIFFWNYQKY